MVPVIPNEAGRLERRETPGEGLVGGVPTSVLRPASEPQGSHLDQDLKIHPDPGSGYQTGCTHPRKKDMDERGHRGHRETCPGCERTPS